MTSPRTIDWYFDFISPYAYLQSESLHKIAGHVRINYIPVLFAGLLKHWEHKGPAEIPPKRTFTYRHALWLARRHGIAFRAPPVHPFNSLNALRLALAMDSAADAVQMIFRFIWAEGKRCDDAADWRELSERSGLADPTAAISLPEVKAALRANTNQAIEQGVFGVPTSLVDGNILWGFDTTEMLLDYLAAPAQFSDPEMQRMAQLPVGVERRKN